MTVRHEGSCAPGDYRAIILSPLQYAVISLFVVPTNILVHKVTRQSYLDWPPKKNFVPKSVVARSVTLAFNILFFV